MGLHQAISNRTTSVPCDCGADDDHVVYTEADSEDQLVDYEDFREADDAELDEEKDVENETEGYGEGV